jgi:ribosome biogenesis protein Tsr3
VSWRIFPGHWAIVPLVPEKLSAGQGCTERVADLPRLLHGNTVNYGWRITRVSSITDLLRSIRLSIVMIVEIGRRLRELRESRNLSQGDLEVRTGLLRCYRSRGENEHTVPSV